MKFCCSMIKLLNILPLLMLCVVLYFITADYFLHSLLSYLLIVLLSVPCTQSFLELPDLPYNVFTLHFLCYAWSFI